MKRAFITLAIVACVSLTTIISAGSRRDRGRLHQSRMDTVLNLTTEQREEVRKIAEKYDVKISTLKKDASITREVKKKKIDALIKKKDKQFESVLTKDQVKKWNQWNNTKHKRADKKFRSSSKRRSDLGNKDFHSSANRQKIRDSYARGHKRTNDRRADANFGSHKRDKFTFDEDTSKKLEILKQKYIKEKEAIKKSLVKTEAEQQQTLKLRQKYRDERKNIIREARQKKAESNIS